MDFNNSNKKLTKNSNNKNNKFRILNNSKLLNKKYPTMIIFKIFSMRTFQP